MYTSQVDVSSLFSYGSITIHSLPFDEPLSLSFNLSCMAGLLGGGNAVSATATILVYRKRC